MNKFNGIILNGKVYEATPRGSYHCSDCDPFDQCKENPAVAIRDQTRRSSLSRPPCPSSIKISQPLAKLKETL